MEEFHVSFLSQIVSYYPDDGGFNYKHLFNCHITPRTSNINQKCFRILFCHNEAFGTFAKSPKFQSDYFSPLLPIIQKRKKSNSSRTSSVSKNICLKLPKMECLLSRFNKDKQSKPESKPCLKPNRVKERLIKSTFVTESNFVLPETKRHFCYNWLGLYPLHTYSPVCDGEYCLFGAFLQES